MFGKIASVNGVINYSTSGNLNRQMDIDTSKAVFYLTPAGIKYGVIISAYRKVDTVVYNEAKLDEPLALTYQDGKATITGKIKLYQDTSQVGDELDFKKILAVVNDIEGKSVSIDGQNFQVTNVGDGTRYKKINIYATIHFQ